MKLGFCVSGGGRVVQALMEARNAGFLSFEPGPVWVDKAGSFSDRARALGMPVELVERSGFAHREEFRAALASSLTSSDVDALFLTFDWLLPQAVVSQRAGRILNLHMGLLPYLPGKGAIDAAVRSGANFAGVTCHVVDAGMDTGPVVIQGVTPVLPGVTPDQLGFDLFRQAVPICIQAVRWLERGDLGDAADGRVRVRGARSDGGLYSPALDADIASFSSGYLDREYPAAV